MFQMVDRLEKDMRIFHFYVEKQLSLRQTASAVPCTPGYAKKVLMNKFNLNLRSIKETMALRSTPEYIEKIRLTQTGEANHQSILSETAVVQIRIQYEWLLHSLQKTEAQKMLAENYGVKRPTISDIVLRKTWKHI